MPAAAGRDDLLLHLTTIRPGWLVGTETDHAANTELAVLATALRKNTRWG